MDGVVLERWAPPAPDPSVLLAHARPDDRPFILASGPGDPGLSGWSYGGLEPVDQAARLEEALPRLAGWASAQGVPFPGGWVGYLGYDLGFEYLKRPRPARLDPLGLPSANFYAYDAIYARETRSGVGWLVAQAHPGAQARLDRLRKALRHPRPVLTGALSAPMVPRVNQALHQGRIEQLLEAIRAGEVYQANLSYALEGRYRGSPTASFLRLLERAPPFAAYLGLGGEQTIVSASPECFFDLDGSSRQIRAYPIKGTRRRAKEPMLDRELARTLAADPKERAEHLMIVDLLRNDLGRVAEPGSVQVDGLCYVESFPTVHHLSSRIEATLRPEVGTRALLEALFPGGSITGAPKQRAMEWIDALEGEARGVYTGAILYAAPNGSIRSSIAIRTAAFAGEAVRLGVGGGIVADSVPEREWEETVLKAQALSQALLG